MMKKNLLIAFLLIVSVFSFFNNHTVDGKTTEEWKVDFQAKEYELEAKKNEKTISVPLNFDVGHTITLTEAQYISLLESRMNALNKCKREKDNYALRMCVLGI